VISVIAAAERYVVLVTGDLARYLACRRACVAPHLDLCDRHRRFQGSFSVLALFLTRAFRSLNRPLLFPSVRRRHSVFARVLLLGRAVDWLGERISRAWHCAPGYWRSWDAVVANLWMLALARRADTLGTAFTVSPA